MHSVIIYFIRKNKIRLIIVPPLAGVGCSIKGKVGEGVEKVE
jgi:hypothetical protein